MCQRNATHSDWIWYLMENYCTCEYSARISASGMYIGSGILFTLIYKTDKVKLLYEKVLNRNSSLTFFFLSYQYFFSFKCKTIMMNLLFSDADYFWHEGVPRFLNECLWGMLF